MNTKQIIYTLRMNVDNFIRDLSNIWFTIRFAFYKWWYKGASNIPPDIIGSLVGGPNNDVQEKAIVAGVEVYSALKAICELFHLNYMETKFFEQFSLMLHGQLTNVKDSERFDEILSSDTKRVEVFNAMVELGDIKPYSVEWTKHTKHPESFDEWLRKNE
jgi:hypothetical protein